jgi:hypothetical protein
MVQRTARTRPYHDTPTLWRQLFSSLKEYDFMAVLRERKGGG